MDDKAKKIRKRTYSNKEDGAQKIAAIGKLLFFDYKNKKFGLIAEIKCDVDLQVEKVHVSESGLTSDIRLREGEIVTLLLHNGPKGFYATNVKSFREIDLKTISQLKALIGINDLEKAVYNTVKSDYQKLNSEEKDFIVEIIQKECSIDAWDLLNKIGVNEQLINNYISVFISHLDDKEKLNFLNKSFSTSLLNNILINWKNQDRTAIFKLADLIRNNEPLPRVSSKAFINVVTNLAWNFEEVWKIYSVFKESEIAYQVVNLFSFKVYNYIDKLKSLTHKILIDESITEKLKSNLNSEIESISATDLLDIFTKLNDYRIIKDENELLELLSEKPLTESIIISLIKQLSDDCKIPLFREIISKSMENLSSWQIIELIKCCDQKNNLAKVLIEEYYYNECKDSTSDYSLIISFLKRTNNFILRDHFIDKFYEEISIRKPFDILELAIVSKHIIAQKFAYQNIIFKTETEIVNFIERVSKYHISEDVKASNKPLTAFILFFNSTSSFNLTEECKRFFQIQKGIVQCLSIKYLIFHFHNEKLNKTDLLEILKSFEWTEISALLIKAFIQESNYTEKILLDKLNGVFKNHFDVLSRQSFESQSFLDNFTIRNILNSCNGRKYYNADLWQKNGVSRWYVNGGVSTYTKDTMLCFCEGRPWKKESFWHSQTNMPSTELYEFYWCKTSYCAARNDTVSLDQPFNDWTLSEISEALNIKIEKIAIATLAGWANRMNQIIEHLFCRTCNEVLRPLPFRPDTLGYYAVPLFYCINEKCTDKQTIRFTHCLNGKCESHKNSQPLDSRDCRSCNPSDINHTGLECNYCGSSCPSCSGQNKKILVKDVW